jgi:hypothetical protein
MNERIEALIEQAENYAHEQNYLYPGEVSYILEFKEKFAELLIGECLSILSDAHDSYANPGKYEPADYYQEMRAKKYAMEDAISSIKNRFGVEP